MGWAFFPQGHPALTWLPAQQCGCQPAAWLVACAWAWFVEAAERACLWVQWLSWCLTPCCLHPIGARATCMWLAGSLTVALTLQVTLPLPGQWQGLGQ